MNKFLKFQASWNVKPWIYESKVPVELICRVQLLQRSSTNQRPLRTEEVGLLLFRITIRFTVRDCSLRGDDGVTHARYVQ